MLHRLLVAAPVILMISSNAVAQKKEMAAASLVADVAAIQPGTPFTLGLLLEIEPGWHTYWKNPGDSGVPTRVQLELPEGFVASELSFPVPARFETPDGVNFGYADSVLHTLQITPPADLKAGQEVTLGVKAKFLVCKNVCIPGGTSLQITLPVSDADPKRANEELFAQWSPRLPVKADDSAAVREVTVSSGSAPPGAIIEWKQDVKDVAVFPGKEDALELNFEVVNDGLTSRIHLTGGIAPGERLKADALPVIIAYTDANGDRRGIEVELPLASLKKTTEQAEAKE